MNYEIPLPKFDGHPLSYPGWKQEMQEELLPGCGEFCTMRLLSELSGEKDIRYMKTQAEAWKYLDDRYANPRLVSVNAIKKFIKTSNLKGANDRAKLVSLFQLLRECHLTLEVVKKLEQLTDFDYTVGHAIDLLPDIYKEQFVEKLDEAVKDSEDGLYMKASARLTARAEYTLLSEWLEKKVDMFRNYGLV